MFENEKDVQKLVDFLRRKSACLSEQELEKVARELLDLGYFLVHLSAERHFRKSEEEDK